MNPLSRPTETAGLRRVLRALSVVFVIICILMISVSPSPWPGSVQPMWILMPVYYWAVYSPALLPPGMLFLSGLILDLMGGGLIGLHATTLVAVQWFVRSQRRFLAPQPFLMQWALFSIVAGVTALGLWCLASLLRWHVMPPAPAVINWLLTIAFFPPVAWLLLHLHKLLNTSD